VWWLGPGCQGVRRQADVTVSPASGTSLCLSRDEPSRAAGLQESSSEQSSGLCDSAPDSRRQPARARSSSLCSSQWDSEGAAGMLLAVPLL
jgi:hypothetical protein